jgi:hippurate hydrolase
VHRSAGLAADDFVFECSNGCAVGGHPPDPELTSMVSAAHHEHRGGERVAPRAPSMATEDFAPYGAAGRGIHGCTGVPLSCWMVGTVGPRQWAATPGANAAERLAALPPDHSARVRPPPVPRAPYGDDSPDDGRSGLPEPAS